MMAPTHFRCESLPLMLSLFEIPRQHITAFPCAYAQDRGGIVSNTQDILHCPDTHHGG